MTKYLDRNGKIIEVLHGLGDWWIVGSRNHRTGGFHRKKSPALPPRKTAEECQHDLNTYASKHMLWSVE